MPRTSNFAFDARKFEQNLALKLAVKTLNLTVKFGRPKFKHAKAASSNFPRSFIFIVAAHLANDDAKEYESGSCYLHAA